MAGLVLFFVLLNMHLLVFIDAGVYEVTKTDQLKQRTSSYYNYNIHNNYNFYWTTTPRNSVQYRQVYSCFVDPQEYPVYFEYIYSYWDAFHAIVSSWDLKLGLSFWCSELNTHKVLAIKIFWLLKELMKRVPLCRSCHPTFFSDIIPIFFVYYWYLARSNNDII